MAFGFFQDKSKGPREVTCPLCQNHQLEPRLAVSSYCKSCRAYLTFEKGGEVKARPVAPPDPFAHRPPQPKVEIEYKAREESPDPAPRPLEADAATSTPPSGPPEISAEAPVPKLAPVLPEPEPILKEVSAPRATPTEEETTTQRYHGRDEDEKSTKGAKLATREVTCFECGDSHPANIHANSTQCRSCGRLISMQDREIREPWSSRIQTRGNVHIFKKGVVLGAAIQCHNLIVEGDFTGDVECSGDLILRRHGKITGKVICKRLLVEKRAKIEFLKIVETDECRIDGLVTGHLACRGLLALEKRATLTGNIKVGRLTVADGAKHSGQIQMGGF